MNDYRKSEYTPIKDKHFKEIILTAFMIARHIINKNEYANKIFNIWDLTAGLGKDEDGRIGSPITFLQEAIAAGLLINAYFFEQDKKTRNHLKSCLEERFLGGFEVLGDHVEKLRKTFLPPFKWENKANYGLLYADPSGKVPPFDLIGEFSRYKSHKYIDILIHVAPTTIKRIRGGFPEKNVKRLSEYLAHIHKKCWIVREPYRGHQWTFLLGTNWLDFPKFEKLGFHLVVSPRGCEIMDRLTYTAEELKNGA